MAHQDVFTPNVTSLKGRTLATQMVLKNMDIKAAENTVVNHLKTLTRHATSSNVENPAT